MFNSFNCFVFVNDYIKNKFKIKPKQEISKKQKRDLNYYTSFFKYFFKEIGEVRNKYYIFSLNDIDKVLFKKNRLYLILVFKKEPISFHRLNEENLTDKKFIQEFLEKNRYHIQSWPFDIGLHIFFLEKEDLVISERIDNKHIKNLIKAIFINNKIASGVIFEIEIKKK